MGPLKLLFITEPERVLRVYKDRIELKDGTVVKTEDLSGLLIFGRVKGEPLVPTAFVSEKELSFKNLRVVSGDYENKAKLCIMELWKRTRSVVKSFPRIRNPRELLAWTEIEPLLFRTLCGLLVVLLSSEVVFKTDPERRMGDFELWKVMFLLPVSYAVLKEVSRTVKYDLSKIREPKVAVGTALSYLFGDPFFFHLLRLNRDVLGRYGLLDPHLSETHGGLSPHSRKLSELSQCVHPL